MMLAIPEIHAQISRYRRWNMWSKSIGSHIPHLQDSTRFAQGCYASVLQSLAEEDRWRAGLAHCLHWQPFHHWALGLLVGEGYLVQQFLHLNHPHQWMTRDPPTHHRHQGPHHLPRMIWKPAGQRRPKLCMDMLF